VALIIVVYFSKVLSSYHISRTYIETALVLFLLHEFAQPPVIFEKLIVTQLIKKFPALYGTQNVHYHVHKSPSLIPILSQMSLVHTHPPSLFL
jgi:hypothetical protein